jgi:hypothetical protein
MSHGEAKRLSETGARTPALEVFWGYTRAFQALDPKAVAAFFHEPAMLITPRGARALPNTWAVERAYAEIMDELRGTSYARTEFSSASERRLDDELVAVTGNGTWVDRDGRRYMPFGFTYTLRWTELGYRIVIALVHAPGSS